MTKPRLQDLTRQQACAVSSRVAQRAAPLIFLKQECNRNDVSEYFSTLFAFTRLLADIGVGNLEIDEKLSEQAVKFDRKLGKSSLFAKESVMAGMAISCVADSLGNQSTRYFASPGLLEADRANPETNIIVGHVAYCAAQRGMTEEFFLHPVALDCEFIFSHRKETGDIVDPAFFARELWPSPGLYIKDDGLPPAVRYAIIPDWEKWLENMGLSGLVASYEACLRGVNLVQVNRKKDLEGRIVSNYVTLNFGPGASFTGPLNVGENIRVSYETASSVSKDELRSKLEEMVRVVGKLAESVESDETKTDVSAQLAALVQEAKKEKPSKSMLNVTANGLLEAAKTVASLAAPVTSAVRAVLELVSH